MATTHGKDGQVRIGSSAVAAVTQWNGTFDSGFADTVYLGDEYGAQIGGIKRMTGSLNCDTDTGDTNGQVALKTAVTGQTTARLYLYINTTKYYEFNANLELVDTVDVGDVVKRVYNYRSNGTITAP
jgi:hypothetical protein